MSAIDATIDRVTTIADLYRKPLLTVGAIFVMLWPFMLESSLLYDVTLVFLYGLLAFSAIVPIGYAGQLILSQGAFFGIGAYTYVKLVGAGVPPVVAVLIAVIVTAAIAYVLGWPATRASGIYLGIITLAFNELFVIALELFPKVTGGSTGIESPSLFPDVLTAIVPSEYLFYYLLVTAFVLSYLGFRRLLDGETGWAFLSIKEDPTVAESIGIDSHRYRLLSFTIAGSVCGFAGSLYAPLTGYLSPTMFDLNTSINIILAGMIGGLTVPVGSIFGGGVVVLVPKFLRVTSGVRLILYGTLLILVLIYLPRGIGGWVNDRLE